MHGQWEEHSYSIGAVGYHKRYATWRWDEESGGYAEQYTEDTTGYVSDTGARYWLWPDGTEEFEAWVDSPEYVVSTDPEDLQSWFGQNFDVKGPWADGSLRSTFTYEGFDYDYRQSARNVKVEYRPSGKTRPGGKDLYEAYGGASEVVPQESYSEPFGGGPLIPPEQITVKGFGETLDENNNDAYAALAAGSPVEVTLEASKPYRTMWVLGMSRTLITETVATTPSDRARLTIGVGEEVNLSFKPPVVVNYNWSCDSGSLSYAQNYHTKFTAPSNQATAVVTMQYGNAKIPTTFKVVEPSGIKATKRSEQSFTQGSVGAGMYIDVVLQPTTVSFYKVQVKEPPEDAMGIEGYFETNPPPDHDSDHGADVWHPVNYANLVVSGVFDHAWIALPSSALGQSGGFTWPIDAIWRVGAADTTTDSLNGWTPQVFTLSSGTMTIQKLGLSVTRNPSQ